MTGEIARLLLDSGCVAFNFAQPFRYTSGLLSPVYCDCRGLLSQPRARDRVVVAFESILENAGAVNLVAGVATAGVPYASMLADRTGLPLCYVRKESREHGRKRQIEGLPDVAAAGPGSAGARAVLLEDTVTTGGSVLAAAQALADAGVEVLGCLSIMTYRFPATESAFADRGLPLRSLTNFPSLVEEGRERGRLDAAEREQLLRWWQEQP